MSDRCLFFYFCCTLIWGLVCFYKNAHRTKEQNENAPHKKLKNSQILSSHKIIWLIQKEDKWQF